MVLLNFEQDKLVGNQRDKLKETMRTDQPKTGVLEM